MNLTVKLILGVSTLGTVFALAGCKEDTAIAFVDGGGGAPGETGQPQCPAGPAAPLGVACSSPGQLCRYGYNVPNCGGRTVICTGGKWIEDSHTDPGPACFDAGAGETASDGNQPRCCPRDPTLSGCLNTGGWTENSCGKTCDFWCSTNWRVETDSHGCEVWRWDTRAPAPGENMNCLNPLDAGASRDGSLTRVPAVHRSAGTTCPGDRGTASLCTPDPQAGPAQCSKDSDCAAGSNGRCLSPDSPLPQCNPSCSYDECRTDADCPSHAACECRDSAGSSAANRCVAGGNCAVDSDCGPGGYCSPGSFQNNCQHPIYFCHTAKDTCLDDADCPATASGTAQSCNYDPQSGHFACGLRCFLK